MAMLLVLLLGAGMRPLGAVGAPGHAPVAASPPPPSASFPYCGPRRGQTSDAWHDEMLAFRVTTRAASNITGAFCTNASDLFGRNGWASSVFVWPLTMMMDRMLYNSATHSWTVDRFLADVRGRYGGVDGVLLWQSYTNMGVDNRNQIDLLRCAPGGLPGLTDLIDQFHLRNVSVIFPWNQWAGNYTNGPREESDFNFPRVLSAIGADGFNADSAGRSAIPGERGYSPHQLPSHGFDGSSFVQWSLDNVLTFHGHDLLDQPEHAAGCPVGNILGGWAGEGGGPSYYDPKGPTPSICAECAKWIEPRHLTQFVERNQVLRQPALKWAFFNGNGYSTWESIWGGWNGVSPRDGETIRRIYSVFRQFKAALVSCEYRPFVPVSCKTKGVHAQATVFPTPEVTLWTVVNTGRGYAPLQSFNLTLAGVPQAGSKTARYFDVWRGKELNATAGVLAVGPGQQDEYGAVAAVSPAVAASPGFLRFLSKMAGLSATPIQSFDPAPVTSQNFSFELNLDTHHSAPSPPRPSGSAAITVPGTAGFRFTTTSLLGEPHLQPRYFGRVALAAKSPPGTVIDQGIVAMAQFEIDTHPVTNAMYDSFLRESGYTPADPINFLRHWGNESALGDNVSLGPPPARPPSGMEKQPVVFVGFEDADRFCRHYGWRLPNEWEWAYSAQGNESSAERPWPWGSHARQECMPPSYRGRGTPPLPDVDAFDAVQPSCGSPLGLQLMVGTVWQWTNAMHDDHTRAGILKGGSSYWRRNATDDAHKPSTPPPPPCNSPDQNYCGRPRSAYYFPNCASETFVNWAHGGEFDPTTPTACQGELLLMDGGYERSATIGFRCARSLGPQPRQPRPSPPPAPGPGPSPAGGPKSFSSLPVAYSWSDGTPDVAAVRASTGVYWPGSFELQVKVEAGQKRVLLLYVGAFCWGAKLTATLGTSVVSKVVKPAPACAHVPAASQNLFFEITFVGPLTVTWERDSSDGDAAYADGEEDGEGNLTWQSAALANATASSSCTVDLCVADPQPTPATTDLTKAGGIDWAHWGGSGATGASKAKLPWLTESKAGAGLTLVACMKKQPPSHTPGGSSVHVNQ